MSAKTIDQSVIDVLKNATTDGNKMILPPGQLDRKLYTAVNKVIDAMGGKWKGGKVKAHLFADDVDPSGMLIEVLETGMMPEKNPLAFFASTEAVAEMAAKEACLDEAKDGEVWLEPSCGDGAILKAMQRYRQGKEVTIYAVEVDTGRAKISRELGIADESHECDFLEFFEQHKGQQGMFDRIVMNPPFSIKGNPYVYIDHIFLAHGLLKPGGVLVSVAPAGITFNSAKKAAGLRELVSQSGSFKELPEGAFKESGTGVSTVLVKISA
jgi:predicted RNA methylase